VSRCGATREADKFKAEFQFYQRRELYDDRMQMRIEGVAEQIGVMLAGFFNANLGSPKPGRRSWCPKCYAMAPHPCVLEAPCARSGAR